MKINKACWNCKKFYECKKYVRVCNEHEFYKIYENKTNH